MKIAAGQNTAFSNIGSATALPAEEAAARRHADSVDLNSGSKYLDAALEPTSLSAISLKIRDNSYDPTAMEIAKSLIAKGFTS